MVTEYSDWNKPIQIDAPSVIPEPIVIPDVERPLHKATFRFRLSV